MKTRLIRPLLLLTFLISIEVWLTFWSQVGGQYHLDLMFWPWKFGLTLAAAAFTAAIAMELFRGVPERPGKLSPRAVTYAVLLILVMAAAGIVTYYYHVNEPADEDTDTPTTTTTELRRPYCRGSKLIRTLPFASISPVCSL